MKYFALDRWDADDQIQILLYRVLIHINIDPFLSSLLPSDEDVIVVMLLLMTRPTQTFVTASARALDLISLL